jgi:hypothetical protein
MIVDKYGNYVRKLMCFKHVAGQDILLLGWRQVLSYDVLLLNICFIVNVIALAQLNYNLK